MSTAGPGWTIRPGSISDLEAVRPLWLAIHERHQAAAPELGPYVSDEESWAVRRRLYERVLADGTGLLLIAERAGEAIGYALARIEATADTWVADTWTAGTLFGEIESLAVAAPARGSGLASALLDAAEGELAARGAQDIGIGVVTGNDTARAIYERRGYRPAYTHLVRFGGRASRAPDLTRSSEDGAPTAAG